MSSSAPQKHTAADVYPNRHNPPENVAGPPIVCLEQGQPREASLSNEEYVCVTAQSYQEILRRVTHNDIWPQYFLLINACSENIKRLPTTSEQCDRADIETLLIECLERLADAIAIILPGGTDEFQSYLKHAAYRRRH
jgi:hypothetical protein